MEDVLRVVKAWSNPDGNVNCPYLWFNDRKRKLNLNWIDNNFNDNYWFLALRNTL